MVTAVICPSCLSISAMSFLSLAISSSAFSLLKRRMRAIFISMRRSRSSRVISRMKSFLYGSRRLSMCANALSMSGACSNSLSLYIRSSMNMLSSDAKCSCSSNSPLRICSSRRKSSFVLSTERRSRSLTVRNTGVWLSMTQQHGVMLISQSVNAYSASIVLSLDTPGANCTRISTLSDVLSSTLRILIFPLSTALRIDSITKGVVFPKGISVIVRVLLSSDFEIFARILTRPLRSPSL